MPDPLDVLNRAERDLAEAYTNEMQYAGIDGSRVAGLERLAILRQHVWVAAIKGQETDGSPVETGWSVDLRAQRYQELAKLSGWNP